MTTGTWNQDLCYKVLYKTNKSIEYVLYKEGLKTTQDNELDFSTIQLGEDEYITEICFDFGKVDMGFKERISPTMNCKALITLQNGEQFTNYTKTIGTYYELKVEAYSKWTTIVHKPKEVHPKVLPRTGA